jgi:DNA modification methylase
MRVVNAECVEFMRSMPGASVDAIVTDPPYGLWFMGKEWDDLPPGPEWAAECLRVLKPGGHLLAFGGTRTYHRLAVAIEDAGFEIRDTICWLYGSGFPKSHNLKDEWQGWGTALKPAHEPVVVARKPFKGTVAANVLEHGVGAVNVDGCRVGRADGDNSHAGHRTATFDTQETVSGGDGSGGWTQNTAGRWPANVVLDEDAAGMLDAQTPDLKMQGNKTHGKPERGGTSQVPNVSALPVCGYGDKGGASRFFYVAKASSRERNAGLDDLAGKRIGAKGNGLARACSTCGASVIDGCACPDRTYENPVRKNHHPTVKPIALMRWLVRLVTPPGGTVLDPFAGSGTTGCACVLEGFDFIGVERELEYVEIARARIAHWTPDQLELAA